MARHKQPLELAKLKGLDKKNPQYYRAEPPQHADVIGDPPKAMDEDAKDCWYELLTATLPGTMTGAERVMLEIASNTLAEYRRDPVAFPVSKVNTLIGLLARFGMSPADRQKLGIEKKDEDDNPYAKLKPIR